MNALDSTVYLLKQKDEALHYFKIYRSEVENQLKKKSKWLWSNQMGEYFSNEFCVEHGIDKRNCHTHHDPMRLPRERTTL